jgi:hypothetical protein
MGNVFGMAKKKAHFFEAGFCLAYRQKRLPFPVSRNMSQSTPESNQMIGKGNRHYLVRA